MKNELIAKQSIELAAAPSSVWSALTDPEKVKQYFFGTRVISDWKVGGPIIFKGEWEGHTYEDKGTILEFIPERKLAFNYWSSLSETEDILENYANITYMLTPNGNSTLLEVTQDKVDNEEKKSRSEEDWKTVLENLKEFLS